MQLLCEGVTMKSMMKKFLLTAVACACVGTASYCTAGAAGVSSDMSKADAVKTDMSQSVEVANEAAAPKTGMPNPVHEFKTVDEAAQYMNIVPQLPKVMPVGFNIESVSTINKDILQVIYTYRDSADATRNQAAGKSITYRVSNLKEDISGDYKHYKVTAVEKVDGMKVTFKGGEKMVYRVNWFMDGQNHSMSFERPVTRDMAKAIIANTVVQKQHTK